MEVIKRMFEFLDMKIFRLLYTSSVRVRKYYLLKAFPEYLKPFSSIFGEYIYYVMRLLLLWIVCVIYVLCCYAFASVHCCVVVTCSERADLLALVLMSYCEFVTPMWYPGSGVVLDCIDS